jgi:hypothetical protein
MGRVTFEGPVKSNGGFEIGSSKSKSNVAGTVILTGSGTSITLYVPIANTTTANISGTLTVGSISLAPSVTGSTVKIGGASTGYTQDYTSITLTLAASVTLNCNTNSKFLIAANTSSGGYSLTPVGGYSGQRVTLIWSAGSTSSIVFASSSSLAIRLQGTTATGWAGLAGSVHAIHFLNVGPGLNTPTTQSTLIEITKSTDLGALM